jgi:hypothetical protein
MLYFSQMKVRRSFLLPSQGDPLRPPLLLDVKRAKVSWVKDDPPQLLSSSYRLVGLEC